MLIQTEIIIRLQEKPDFMLHLHQEGGANAHT